MKRSALGWVGTALGGTVAVAAAVLEAPVIAAMVAVGAVGAGIYALTQASEESKKECPFCGGKFDELNGAASMMPLVAPAARPEMTAACSECVAEKYAAEIERYAKAVSAKDAIQSFPRTYKGRVPVDSAKPKKQIESRAFRDRTHAEDSLRITAAFLGYTVVYEIEFQKSEGADGNYIYSIWSAAGALG